MNKEEQQSSTKDEKQKINEKKEEHKTHEENKHSQSASDLNKKITELEKKNKELEEKLNSSLSELNESKTKASQYLSTASYYKSQAETNKKDFDRYKERNKDIEKQAKTDASELMAKKLLPIIDNFDQAISQVDAEIMKGFSMIYSSLINILTELGVTEIECKESELNPEIHNCISTEKTEDDSLDGKIAVVYQKGYKFAETEKVIRPATVSVYKK